MDVYLAALGLGTEEGRRASHESLRVQHHLMAPYVMLLFLRVGLFFRIAAKGPAYLLPVLSAGAAAKRSWLSAVQDDLALLASKSACFGSMQGVSLAGWADMARSDLRLARQSLAKAVLQPEFNKAE
eukprot:1727204-Karenia_brevis.AAC.1